MWQETRKNVENEIQPLFYWNIARNTEKCEKWEMHTLGPGVWRET